MKKVLILLLIIVVLIFGYFFGLTNIIEKNKECNGFEFKNYCIDNNTSEKTLIKLGLIEKYNNNNHEINVVYPKNIIKYPKLHKHLKEQTSGIKEEFGFNKISNNRDTPPRTLSIKCEESSDNIKYISILCRFTEYTVGSNPSHGFSSTNFNIKTNKIVELDDLFPNKLKALNEISDYVIKKIYSQKSERSGELIDKDEIIEKGASPTIGNYLNYIFVYENDEISGINFMFPNFQVGSQAEGSYEVLVPKKIYIDFLVKDK